MTRIRWSGGDVAASEADRQNDLSAERAAAPAAGAVDTAGAVRTADAAPTAGAVPTVDAAPVRPEPVPEAGAVLQRAVGHEEVARIQVEPEDRLAFRVGVNILTLLLVGLAVYLVWRRFFAGG